VGCAMTESIPFIPPQIAAADMTAPVAAAPACDTTDFRMLVIIVCPSEPIPP
jgi:hypothetical protein